MKQTSTLTFCGGAGTVTGANFLLEIAGKRILVDCGLTHKEEYCSLPDYAFPYDPESIDVVLITHAHADHIGRLPKLMRDGFDGAIYSTEPTRQISHEMLDDALGIVSKEAQLHGCLPLYFQGDVRRTFTNWQVRDYHERFSLGDGIDVEFFDAGHVLGSAMIRVSREGKSIVFTGDLGNSPAPLLPDTEPLPDADYLLMESVYGDRNHEDRDQRRSMLRDVITASYKKGGILLIPSFALERTQVLILELNNLVESGEVPQMPVYLDSPLAASITSIYKHNTKLFNARIQQQIAGGDDIFAFPEFVTISHRRQSEKLDSMSGPAIIIAGSGMSIGGRIRRHEQMFLENEQNTLLFVGYQANGTLGRTIQDGAKRVTIDKKDVTVRAHIESIRGYSAHKDSDNLFAFVGSGPKRPKEVFVAMGEPESSAFLAGRIEREYGIIAHTPRLAQEYTIEV